MICFPTFLNYPRKYISMCMCMFFYKIKCILLCNIYKSRLLGWSLTQQKLGGEHAFCGQADERIDGRKHIHSQTDRRSFIRFISMGFLVFCCRHRYKNTHTLTYKREEKLWNTHTEKRTVLDVCKSVCLSLRVLTMQFKMYFDYKSTNINSSSHYYNIYL